MHCSSQNILKKSAYGTANGKTVFLSFQRDFPSKQSVTNSWWFLQVNFLEWRVVFSHILENEVFKDCCQFFFTFFLSFCFFSCHPELSRQLSQTVLADNFTVVEHLAGYLFASQAGCTWLCKCCEQMQWWECDGQGGGCLSTTDRGPSTRVQTIHDSICQEFCMWAVQHSHDPLQASLRGILHHLVLLKELLFLWIHVLKLLVFHSVCHCTPFPPFDSRFMYILTRGCPLCLRLNCCPLMCSLSDFRRFQRQIMRASIMKKLTFHVYHSMG